MISSDACRNASPQRPVPQTFCSFLWHSPMFSFRFTSTLLITCLAISQLPLLAAQPPEMVKEPARVAKQKPLECPLFFVTNRKDIDKNGQTLFTSDRSNKLSYGVVAPGVGSEGKLEKAIKLFASKQEFLDALKRLSGSRTSVFVHGYRKSFDGSLEYGRQLVNNLHSPVVVFAWPSKNKYSNYMADECTAEWSAFSLAESLSDIGKALGAEKVQVISHSLGARMVAWSLRILASENKQDEKFGSMVFCSPDFDRDTFMAETPLIKKSAGNVKIYLNSHDSRIWLSKVLHGNPRLGTMDESSESIALQKLFECDMSLPSHHIPFPLLTAGTTQKSESASVASPD